MKRYLFLIIIVILGQTLYAQKYSIYKCSDGVMIKHLNSTEWESCKKRDNLSLVDLIRIPENSSIVILDKTTNRLYKNSTEGEKKVKSIIDESIENANKVVKLLNSEIVQNTKSDNSNSYSSYGSIVRGDDEEVNALHMSICNYLIAVSRSNDLCTADDLIVRLKEDSLDEITFEFTNNTDKVLFVNVIRINSRSEFSLCYVFDQDTQIEGCMLGAKSNKKITEYVFAKDTDENVTYIPFGTTFAYDSKLLQLLLQSNNEISSETIVNDEIIVGNAIQAVETN